MSNPLHARCIVGCLLAASICTIAPVHDAAADNPVAAATAVELMKRDLVGDPNKEVLMLAVSYPAAGSSLPHRHDAEVFVYVLEGTMTMQVRGGLPVSLRQGDVFYEGPEDVHLISANASASKPAKILVVMIKDKRKAVSRTAAD